MSARIARPGTHATERQMRQATLAEAKIIAAAQAAMQASRDRQRRAREARKAAEAALQAELAAPLVLRPTGTGQWHPKR